MPAAPIAARSADMLQCGRRTLSWIAAMIVPDRETFRRRAEQGNLVPVYREILADMDTPVSAFRKIGTGDYAFLLESVERGEQPGRHSFLGGEPFLVFRSRGRQVTIERAGTHRNARAAPRRRPPHRAQGAAGPVSLRALRGDAALLRRRGRLPRL